MSNMANEGTIEEIGQRAQAAAESGRPLTAVVLLEQLRALTGLTSHQMYLLADSLRIVGRRREALALFENLQQRDLSKKKRFYVSLRIGDIYSDVGDLAKAEESF